MHAGGRSEGLQVRMREAQIEPDEETFTILITSCCRMQRWNQITLLLDEMETRGIPKNQRIYGTMISEYGKCKQLSNAFATLDRMKKEGMQPRPWWSTLL